MRTVLVLVLLGCGAAKQQVPVHVEERPMRAGVPPPSDAPGIRALLTGEVVNGGLWFADAGCQTTFGKPGPVAPAQLDAFAQCLAGLHLKPTGRADARDDTSVLADDNGFEIEAHVANRHLDFIGFSARAPGAPDTPTITPAALESLRVAGNPHPTITADVAKTLDLLHPDAQFVEHLRVCLAETGAVTSVMPGSTTTVAEQKAFAALVLDWKFRPFVVGGKPIAVCAIVGMTYPVGVLADRAARLPVPPMVSNAGHLVYNVRPRELDALRLTGTKNILPDDDDKVHLMHKGPSRLLGVFKLCLDETGHYERGLLIQSTGLSRYDQKIARELKSWTFRPYVVDGVAIPVCSGINFVYTQN